MAKKPNWDEIKEYWEQNSISLSELAKKFGVKLGTLKSRKSRDSKEPLREWVKGGNKLQPWDSDSIGNEKVAALLEEESQIANPDLDERYQLFCLNYLKYYNATKAYQEVYKCSYNTARTNGNRLLARTYIQEEIKRLKKLQMSSLFISGEEVLQRIVDIALSDVKDYVETEDGNKVTLKPLDLVDTYAVSEISNSENGIKIKMTDKLKALELLARHVDLYKERELEELRREKLRAEIKNIGTVGTSQGGSVVIVDDIAQLIEKEEGGSDD